MKGNLQIPFMRVGYSLPAGIIYCKPLQTVWTQVSSEKYLPDVYPNCLALVYVIY